MNLPVWQALQNALRSNALLLPALTDSLHHCQSLRCFSSSGATSAPEPTAAHARTPSISEQADAIRKRRRFYKTVTVHPVGEVCVCVCDVVHVYMHMLASACVSVARLSLDQVSTQADLEWKRLVRTSLHSLATR